MDRSEPLARRHSFHSFHDSTSVPEDGSDVMSIDDDPWLDCRPLSWSYPDNTVVADSGDVGDVGFRVQHVSPMVLCDLCSALNIDRLWNQILSDIARGDCIEHQPDVEALELSASAGCEMCSMFLQGAVATFHRLPGQKFSDAGAIQYLKNKTTRSAPQRPPSWVRALSRGDGPCLVRKINYEDTEGSFIKAIEYGIPVLPLQGYMDFNMKHCLTTQFVLRNCRGYGDERIRQTELGKAPDFAMARDWIDQCLYEHTECSPQSFNEYGPRDEPRRHAPENRWPTRLIHVGEPGIAEPRLVMATQKTRPYVALSHCWGKSRPLTTKSSNIKTHLKSIPLASMPRTFQDAVLATRALGFDYVWIDSLCIIQDSAYDWEVECEKMGHIYESSVVTICGPMAGDSSAGFLRERTCPEPPPRLWEYRNPGEPAYKRATLSSYDDQEPEGPFFSLDYPAEPALTSSEDKSPLRERGWILQEYLLSRRTLFFGLYRMHWQCRCCIIHEDFKTSSSEPHGLYSSIGKDITPPDSNIDLDASRQWFALVREFNDRRLTQPSDKLPAISGLASWFLGGRADDYLAGLLRSHLHTGLAWWVRPAPDNHPIAAPPYRAPSWSWASTDNPVEFYVLPYSADSEFWAVSAQIWEKWDVGPTKSGLSLVSQQHRPVIDEASITLRGCNAFGEVSSGSLKLTASVNRCVVSWETWEPAALIKPTCLLGVEPVIIAPTSRPSAGCKGQFQPDDLAKWGLATADGTAEAGSNRAQFESLGPRREIECLIVDGFRWCKSLPFPQPRLYPEELVCLAIEAIPVGQETDGSTSVRSPYKPYRRIGFVIVWYPRWTHNVDQWVKESRREKIELF